MVQQMTNNATIKTQSAVEQVMHARREGRFHPGFYQNSIGLDLALEHARELDRLRNELAYGTSRRSI